MRCTKTSRPGRARVLRALMIILACWTWLPVATGSPALPIKVLDENAQRGGSASAAAHPEPWLLAAVAGWMTGLPDAMPLAAVSIPGTHDSGSRHGGVAVRTQTWSIDDQLQAGIRYLDIRLRATPSGLVVHHGAFYQHLSFGSVLESVAAFLQSNPGETVLVRVGEEYQALSGSAPFVAQFEQALGGYTALVWRNRGERSPSLGAVRGRIVFLRDAPGLPSDIGLAYADQTIQDAYRTWFIPGQHERGDNVSIQTKKDLVARFIRRAHDAAGSGPLVINHLSGAVGMAPNDVARRVNGATYAHLANTGLPRSTGILVMDFPGERMVYRIIRTNLDGEGRCQARTFRVQSAHSWAEFRLPADRPVGQVLEIRSGAYNRYRFPRCNRVHWSDLSFLCTPDGTWERSKGSWDADGRCHGSRGESPYVFTGSR